MERRALLRRLGTAGVVALAGCAGSGADDSPADETDERTETPTGELPGRPHVTDTSFSVTGRGSGTQRDAATVTTDTDVVTVEGTVWGADGCKTATLAGADYDRGTLTVTVGTENREGADMCTQAIVEIDYRATVTLAGGLPETVEVVHDRGDGGTTVTTASVES
ncbi:hypothetical protein [Haloarcula litorea]|uniref:hypothetical protein n=1 Tax=Haloarcula litorea TaxID=3032579 RepID=UPI0023E8C547|nr:hypothetical protein [Halomicroarcula sp. GDY20]